MSKYITCLYCDDTNKLEVMLLGDKFYIGSLCPSCQVVNIESDFYLSKELAQEDLDNDNYQDEIEEE